MLTEGGPHSSSLLIENNLLDELCLTVAPILVGGVARRIATGPVEVHTRMRRTHLLTDDEGYLYTRYVRGDRPRDRYCGQHASASSAGPGPERLDCAVGFAGRMCAGPGRKPPLRHRLRRRAAGPARDHHRAGRAPPIEAPKNDLSWRDCTSRVFSDAAVQPIPGVTLDCASYDADLDSINGATGTVSIGVVRARSVQTPPDAGPLVMTTGSDLPSSVQLPVWLSRAGATC